MIIQHSGKKIVCRADGVKIAREMQIDVFHRHHLRISAARSAAFDTEHGPQRRFSERRHGVFSYSAQTVGKTYRGSGFPLAGGRRRNRRYKHESAVFFSGVIS